MRTSSRIRDNSDCDFLFLEILRQVFPAAAMNSVEIRAVKNITYCISHLNPPILRALFRKHLVYEPLFCYLYILLKKRLAYHKNHVNSINNIDGMLIYRQIRRIKIQIHISIIIL